MQYKRPRSFNSAPSIRKAIKALNKQFKANAIKKTDRKKDKSKGGKSDGKWTQDKGMFWVTTVLTVVTLLLFWQAFQQTNEVKEEFKIINTPYLQLSKVIDSIHPGQSPIIAYSIENLGKVPCKIIWCEIGDSVSNQPYVNSIGLLTKIAFGSPPQRSEINMYSIEGSPYNAQFTSGYNLSEKVYNDLKSKQSFLYFYGIIDYVDQLSKEERIYNFSAKIIQNPAGAIEMIVNDNEDIDDYGREHKILINK